MRPSCVMTLIVNCRWALLLCCGLISPWTLAQTAPAPALTQQISVLLERMTNALHALNYEGVLVYLHDNRLETLNLLHRVTQGQVQERLVSLSGPVRTVARERDRILSAQPEGQPFAVDPPSSGGHILATEGIDPAALDAHYRIAILGTARIAGRDTEVIGIIPRDALRYGYRFYIDRATALPLKSDLIDQQEEPLEQLMFTTISISPADGATLARSGQPMRNAPATEASSRWRFGTTPAGFQLVLHREIRQPDGALTEHFLFTDRLCAYSIYIEDESQEGLNGVTNTGAVHAAGRTIDGYRVTALGEVPAATVAAAIAGAQRN
ncbi:MucB/RseB C-terminal domain-containing protein [Chromatium okenii]|uniref:MucB/RseB C-terminal domain-containing protein n=1 Tax=Chromatium okenii TaxID=61644 RepID=UPI0026EC0C23|nr:MucB/RseB C-terminal domain-containing protein [Chromatium okenii]MBV5308945.1 MucB/RseB C-terminal domain-containing protein [Chromatium okenii]